MYIKPLFNMQRIAIVVYFAIAFAGCKGNMAEPYVLYWSHSYRYCKLNDRYHKLQLDDIKRFNMTAYDGIAVPIMDFYHRGKNQAIQYSRYGDAIEVINRESDKDIWPQVCFNRIFQKIKIVKVRTENGIKELKIPDSSSELKGLDLWDMAGAKTDFLECWETALRLARDTACPGVMIDTEGYNNYALLDIHTVAALGKRGIEETYQALISFGGEMANIAAQIYPEVDILANMSYLDNNPQCCYSGKIYYPTMGIVLLGILGEAKKSGIPLKVICGGQAQLGYVSKSPGSLWAKMITRQTASATIRLDYENHFELGGTISPWFDIKDVVGTYKTKAGENHPCERFEDFEDYLRLLFSSYRYTWIWGASGTGFLLCKNSDIQESAKLVETWKESNDRMSIPVWEKAEYAVETVEDFESGKPEYIIKGADNKNIHLELASQSFPGPTQSLHIESTIDHEMGVPIVGTLQFACVVLKNKRDWSDYNFLEFSVYIPSANPDVCRVLGFSPVYSVKGRRYNDVYWKFIDVKQIEKGKWSKMKYDLIEARKFHSDEIAETFTKPLLVSEIRFYIGKLWYPEGKVHIYIDDIRLVRISPK